MLEGNLNWYLACLLALVIGAAIGGLCEIAIIQKLATRSKMTPATAVALDVAEQPAPVLGVDDAVERINANGEQFVFLLRGQPERLVVAAGQHSHEGAV